MAIISGGLSTPPSRFPTISMTGPASAPNIAPIPLPRLPAPKVFNVFLVPNVALREFG